jgi:hypothetical protein
MKSRPMFPLQCGIDGFRYWVNTAFSEWALIRPERPDHVAGPSIPLSFDSAKGVTAPPLFE